MSARQHQSPHGLACRCRRCADYPGRRSRLLATLCAATLGCLAGGLLFAIGMLVQR